MRSLSIIKSIGVLSIAASVVIFIMAAVSGCGKASPLSTETENAVSPFTTYRDVPGVTAEEIVAIEALQQAVLQRERTSFIFGNPYTAEAFIKGNGEHGGFQALLSGWLSDLFGIPFKQVTYPSDELNTKTLALEVDFGGNMGITEERLKSFYMTDVIIERQYQIFRLRGSRPLGQIMRERLPRYAFLPTAGAWRDVAAVTVPGSYENVFINNYEAAYNALISGQADAFIGPRNAEAHFITHDDVISDDFYPLIFGKVSLYTANPALEPIISVVTKALRGGAKPYMAHLYEEGYRDYIKYKMSVQLNEADLEYIASHPVVKVVANYDNYPVCFYNTREGEWQGIFFDLLDEISAATGISFKLINENNDNWPVIYELVRSGEASLIADLTWTQERVNYFIWPESGPLPDYLALVSKSDFHNITIGEIGNAKVGVARGTVYASTFKQWFPDHPNTVEYENMDMAIAALGRDEVDLVMSSQRRLMYVTHYLELPGYKTNIIFNQPLQTLFGVNKNEEALCSIIDTALKVIDTDGISERWMRKTYDYRVKVVEAQRPWLIGAIALSLAVLALALILLYRSRVYRKRLVKEESQVMVREADERAQLMLEQAPLVSLLWDDDFHLIDCNQEAVRIFGLSSKKEIMERFFELLPEYQPSGMTSRELFQKAHSLMFKEKTEFARIELTMKHSVSGEAIPFDITLARIKYKDKYAVLSYGLDLRERNATIAKMREADECAQIMFDITPLAGCMFDKDRNMIDCNQEVVKMFGIPDRKFFLNSFFSLLIPKYQPDGSLSADVTAENVRLALEKGYYRFECMHQKLSGEPLPSEITLVCVKYRGENVIAGYFRDLTEQKEKEQLTKEVMGKTSTLTAIFNSTPNIIFCKDINLFYTECNKAMENYFNISRSDVIGKSDLEGLIFSPETAEQLIAVDKRVIAERQTIISEELLPSSDGRLVHFEIIKSPLIQEGEITGLVGMARDITQRKEIGQLAKKQAEAEAANRAKSTFLATMSHEIRTPMNAISGMAELLLRRDLPDEAKAEAQDIKQAATNLVSIINDILDISKIEAGKMEILPVKYMLLSLINDTVNIIRMRLAEKPIRFYTNIDGNIPNNLIGDEVRLRQILLNLLSNAAKYTDKGHISLSIIVQKRVSQSAQADSSKNFLSDPSPQGLARGQIWLEITVADTGKGIKPEDQTKIFDSFVQVDSKKNRSIEGTGLGLAITKQLCQLMNGNITFHSEYGKGSEFKAVIPQGVDSEEAFAAVEEPEKKKVLVYEGRAVYARSLCWSLENLGVPYVMTETLKEFTEALTREEWYYVFSGHGLYEKIKPLMDKAVFLNGKKPPLALMVEWENEANIPGVRFISLPVQSLSIANVLNGKADSRNYFSTQNSGAIRFTYPGAHLLVVDDIPTNLRVAEGLLAPYRAKVDIALSGAMAIELVKQYEYDIVFMDHMMPEMDGIEATAAIREWETEQEKQGITRIAVPIIALTANVVSGMKEMFIEKGFNDFLAKPIDISKLDEMLDRWIPKGKRGISDQGPGTGEPQPPTPDPHSLPAIPGVDIRRGISMTGGTLALYRQVIGLFRNDAEERLPLLQNVPDADALPKFITQVHALKSASASIGAAEISAKAAGLEAAGRAADIGFIQENLPGFVEDLTELIEGIRAWENAEKEQAASKGEGAPGDGHSQAAVIPLLHELETALEAENVGDIRRLLRELGQKPCDAKTKEALGQISDHVLVAEFDSALKIVKELIAANG